MKLWRATIITPQEDLPWFNLRSPDFKLVARQEKALMERIAELQSTHFRTISYPLNWNGKDCSYHYPSVEWEITYG